MRRPAHTVAAAFVQGAVRALPEAERARVLRQVGIDPMALVQPGARVPAAAFGALWLAVARELDDEFFGLDARRMKPGSFALLCHAVVGQGTVERALRQALRGFNLFFDDLAVSLVLQGREARVLIANRIDAATADSDARRFADETLLVMLNGLLCWLAGRRVALARLEMAHPRPPHADEYRRMFSPELRFGAARSAMVFDARVLAARVAADAAGLKAFLRDAPQSVFLKLGSDAHAGLAERLRRRLLRAGARAPTLELLATELRLSPATLRRRLKAEGTNWQRMKDEARHGRALQLLAEDGLSVGDVAARLGFEDASAFHRAFRKWTGEAPGRWRRRTAANAPLPA
jgi:AraC-like DNA-binding protein